MVGSEETIMLHSNEFPAAQRDPWNNGRLIGQKRSLKPKDVWAIRVRLRLETSSPRPGGGRMRDRATVVQKKTGRPVQFEITEQT